MRYKDSIIFLHTKLFRLFFKKNIENYSINEQARL